MTSTLGIANAQFCDDGDEDEEHPDGVNPEVFATCVNHTYTYDDECDPEDPTGTILIEQYCQHMGGDPDYYNCNWQEFSCSTINKICVDGQCVEPCLDSDGGINVYVKGTCTDAGGSYDDACIESAGLSTSVNELFCQSGECYWQENSCPGEMICIDGACTNQQESSSNNFDVYEFSARIIAKLIGNRLI